MDTKTKKRFLAQMLANVEQLEQGCEDLGLVTNGLHVYKIYLLEEYTKAQTEDEKVPDSED